MNIIYLYMRDAPHSFSFKTYTYWITLRFGLKGLVTAIAPVINMKLLSVGSGWICVAGLVSKIVADAMIGLSRSFEVIFVGE
jgi:hypothetical protein